MPPTKAELTAEAEELGVVVEEGDTNAQIAEKIAQAKADDAEDQNASDRISQGAVSQPGVDGKALSDPDSDDDDDDEDDEGLEEGNDPVAAAKARAEKPTYVQGSSGSTYEIGEAEEAPEAEEIAAVESVAEELKDMPRSLLQRLKGAVDGALATKGVEPARPTGPALSEIVASFPVNEDATNGYTAANAAAAAKKSDLKIKASDIRDVAIRQQRGAGGSWVGPRYVRIVTHDGKKHTVEA